MPQMNSFFAGLLDFKDSYVVAPWFGANYWAAVVTPRPRGGVPPGVTELELKMEFKEGGSFDFHTLFVRVKELAVQQAESDAYRASEYGDGGGYGTGGFYAPPNMPAVNLEQLPAYEESASSLPPPPPPPPPQQTAAATPSVTTTTATATATATATTTPTPTFWSTTTDASNSVAASQVLSASAAPEAQRSTESRGGPPAEPPPGYEEVQRESVAYELERSLRERHVVAGGN